MLPIFDPSFSLWSSTSQITIIFFAVVKKCQRNLSVDQYAGKKKLIILVNQKKYRGPSVSLLISGTSEGEKGKRMDPCSFFCFFWTCWMSDKWMESLMFCFSVCLTSSIFVSCLCLCQLLIFFTFMRSFGQRLFCFHWFVEHNSQTMILNKIRFIANEPLSYRLLTLFVEVHIPTIRRRRRAYKWARYNQLGIKLIIFPIVLKYRVGLLACTFKEYDRRWRRPLLPSRRRWTYFLVIWVEYQLVCAMAGGGNTWARQRCVFLTSFSVYNWFDLGSPRSDGSLIYSVAVPRVGWWGKVW